MKFARIVLLAAVLSSALAAILLVTRPAKPITTLVGLSAVDQEKIAAAKAKSDFDAALATFATKLKNAAGQNAIDCGLVPLAEQARSAVACGAAALQNSAPFWVVVEFPGTDTTTWVGIGQDSQNNRFQFVAMCDPWFCAQALANPRVDRCSSISLESRAAERRFFDCSLQGDPASKSKPPRAG
jgi:hypothetical protein